MTDSLSLWIRQRDGHTIHPDHWVVLYMGYASMPGILFPICGPTEEGKLPEPRGMDTVEETRMQSKHTHK